MNDPHAPIRPTEPPAASLSEADVQAWQDVIGRYARQVIQPLVQRPERAMSAASLRELVDGLIELGVLNPSDEDVGGLWDNDAATLPRRLSVTVLQALATHCAGLAYQVHLQALGWHLDRQVQALAGEVTVVSLQGRHGLGREAVCQAWLAREMTAEQQAVLADNWAWPTQAAPRYVHALADWQVLWLPVWSVDEGWTWYRLPRSAVQVAPLAASHGLDELCTQAVWLTPPDAPGVQWPRPTLSGARAHGAWGRLQAMHGAGLLAMSEAVVRRAWAQAMAHAQSRHQGGQTILGHAAVQQLLARAQEAVHVTAQALHGLLSEPSWPDLLSVWRNRAHCQPALSAGASACLQVLGGQGYVRDAGLDKALRDVNQMRLLGGSPSELRTCVAHWEAQLGGWPQAGSMEALR
jgi:hypothetical protein